MTLYEKESNYIGRRDLSGPIDQESARKRIVHRRLQYPRTLSRSGPWDMFVRNLGWQASMPLAPNGQLINI